MHKAYLGKESDPVFSTVKYMVYFQTLIVLSISPFLEKIFLLTNLLSPRVIYGITRSSGFFIGLLAIVLLFSFLSYFRKSFEYYEMRFSKWDMANKYLKIWMLIVLPILILFWNIDIYIWMFGGKIFGKVIIGVFPK